MSKRDDSPPTLRCAIYTRKSTEDGLEQEYNSLDAQRDAGEAYIASQKSEGWVCLPDRYDDGGFTGGNMERPALKRLLTDIEDGKVDCIVVYKVDRLSRSLIDFSKIMDVLERQSVSFVSVTQQFNTSSSMGRLMLNVLLSFAQFEREMISERTRDKIAATRRKGKWSGGMPMLGYDVDPRGGRLHVNDDEAARVREIFELYLNRLSLIEVVKELDARVWTTKRWITRKGHERGGKPFNKNSLFKLLTNRIYLGKITYKDEAYDGEHPAIVDEDIFERAQRLLKRNGRSGAPYVRNRFGAVLKGLVRCVPCECGMVPTHATKTTSGGGNSPTSPGPVPLVEILDDIEYTGMGQVTSMTVEADHDEYGNEWQRVHTAEYDKLGRMTSKTVTSDEYGDDIDRGFDYEPDWVTGQYTRTGPDGVETFVQLDTANRVQSYRRGPANDPVLTATYTYYDDDRVETVSFGNGASIEYSYDNARRLTDIEHRDALDALMQGLSYEYYDNDLPSELEESNAFGVTATARVHLEPHPCPGRKAVCWGR